MSSRLRKKLTAGNTEAADKRLGYKIGWTGFTNFKSLGQGAATTAYAAFDPALRGEWPSRTVHESH